MQLLFYTHPTSSEDRATPSDTDPAGDGISHRTCEIIEEVHLPLKF